MMPPFHTKHETLALALGFYARATARGAPTGVPYVNMSYGLEGDLSEYSLADHIVIYLLQL